MWSNIKSNIISSVLAAIILAVLAGIWSYTSERFQELLKLPDKVSSLEARIQDLEDNYPAPNPLFNFQEWEPQSGLRGGKMQSDGFLQVINKTGRQKDTIFVYGGPETTPSTLLAAGIGDGANSFITLTVPLKKGHYWNIEFNNTANQNDIKVYWMAVR